LFLGGFGVVYLFIFLFVFFSFRVVPLWVKLNGKMKNLQVHNPHFITYQNELFTVDVLGGVDLMQLERMISTLRINYKDYPPMRSTLDLYNDNQTDKLIRTLCEKWDLKLLEVSKTVHAFICELESYKLERLKYPKGKELSTFEMGEQERQTAKKYLSDKNLIQNLKTDFKQLGILGEDENALILFMAMASHKYENPFSVLCLAKSGIGKSYLLQKLSECMPQNAYSFHTQISENALYYFDSHQLDGKVLFIEDLDWTNQMLTPLSTLQTQGKLIKTRATKNKDGLLHSTTFEVSAKLCLIACAYSEKNYENLSLPFLCLHLNHSQTQDIEIMNYQRKISAGLIDKTVMSETAQRLKCVLASLEPVRVINPFAPLIELPTELPHPRKTLLLLLHFVEVVTFFFQHQREQKVNEQTGEIYIESTPEDIKLAFALLKNSLLRKADDLSTSARGFLCWLKRYLTEVKTKQFTALDIRKTKTIHPRTLNRYLQELTLFHYLQITGGNKHCGGFIYKLTELNDLATLQNGIETSLKNTLDRLQPSETKQTEPVSNTEEEKPTFFEKNYKRIRINEKEEYTLKLILEMEAKEPNREYLSSDFTAITGRSQITEARHLKVLWEQGRLNRRWENRQYYYSLPTTTSKTVSQNPMSNTKTQ
jgi:hypothetical protein